MRVWQVVAEHEFVSGDVVTAEAAVVLSSMLCLPGSLVTTSRQSPLLSHTDLMQISVSVWKHVETTNAGCLEGI